MNPMIASALGVRISWLIVERKSDLIRVVFCVFLSLDQFFFGDFSARNVDGRA